MFSKKLILLIVLAVPQSVGGQNPLPQQLPTTMTLVGTILDISGSQVKLASLQNPKFSRTFRIEQTTRVFEKKVEVPPTVLVVGSIVVVRQARSGIDYRTLTIEHLGRVKVR